METKELITKSMAMIPERNFYRFQGLQTMIITERMQVFDRFIYGSIDNLRLNTITKVYLCPPEIVMPYNKDYIILAFDYETPVNPMSVIRIPDKYNTTHFKEKISRN